MSEAAFGHETFKLAMTQASESGARLGVYSPKILNLVCPAGSNTTNSFKFNSLGLLQLSCLTAEPGSPLYVHYGLPTRLKTLKAQLRWQSCAVVYTT